MLVMIFVIVALTFVACNSPKAELRRAQEAADRASEAAAKASKDYNDLKNGLDRIYGLQDALGLN